MADATGLSGQLPVGSQAELPPQVPGGMQVGLTVLLSVLKCCLKGLLRRSNFTDLICHQRDELLCLHLTCLLYYLDLIGQSVAGGFGIQPFSPVVCNYTRYLPTIPPDTPKLWHSSCNSRASSCACFGSSNTWKFSKSEQILLNLKITSFHWHASKRQVICILLICCSSSHMLLTSSCCRS